MKHIHTFENFLSESALNEANTVDNIADVNSNATADAFAKGKNFEELKSGLIQLLQIYREDGNRLVRDAARKIYYDYFIEQGVKSLIRNGMTISPDVRPTGETLESRWMRPVAGKWKSGDGKPTVATPDPKLKNGDIVYCPSLIVDSISKVNMNVSIPVGYANGNKSAGIMDQITFENIEGSIDKKFFWEKYFLYTEVGKAIEAEIPIYDLFH